LIPLTPTLSREGRGNIQSKEANMSNKEKPMGELRYWAVMAGVQGFAEAIQEFRFMSGVRRKG